MYRLRPRARGGLAARARGWKPGHGPGPERGRRCARAVPRLQAKGGVGEAGRDAEGRGNGVRGGAANPVRMRYTKRGKIRWISHRDVARALERAFRVTQLPLAFTEGFSPRPKVSFGLALSTGHESDAEYVDLVLAEAVDLEELPGRLTASLPEGIAVVGVTALADRAPALQEAVTSVEWRVHVAHRDLTTADPAGLRRAVDAALVAPTLITTKHRKGRDVVEDVRPVIRRI